MSPARPLVKHLLARGKQVPNNRAEQVQRDGDAPDLVPGAVRQDEPGRGGAQHAGQHAGRVGQAQQHAAIPRPDVLRAPRD